MPPAFSVLKNLESGIDAGFQCSFHAIGVTVSLGAENDSDALGIPEAAPTRNAG
jgi:hypothetical protein